MLPRYEARLDGEIEPGQAFTDFDERKELDAIFRSQGWIGKLLHTGRGGYYLYNLEINGIAERVHIYLKRITFGGREKRPEEKRAQFSGGLDRAGYDAKNDELCLMLGIYKRDKDWPPVICAWDINDWGYNIGRAFNCFINVKYIAKAYTDNKLVESRSAANQIVYTFTPDKFYNYLDEKKNINAYATGAEAGQRNTPVIGDLFSSNTGKETIPNYIDLFQCIIDILKSDKYGGKASVSEIEAEAADKLKLSENARIKIHNPKEGNRTELGYQLAWARTYLKLAGLIYSPQRSFWALTTEGWDIQAIDTVEIITMAKGKNAQKEFEQDDEDIEPESIEPESKDTTASEISYPFDASKVDIRTRTMSLDLILKRLDHYEIDLNTGFQRKAGLWDDGKQSRLIESIMIRFPLPAFYFDGSNDDMWLIVDGLQRVTALNRYVNKEEFALTGLEFLTEYTGKKFSQLPGFLKRRIQEFEITAYVIAAGTPADLKYNVFKRINTGGLMLSDQEIRNALNQGTASRFIKDLSTLTSFRLATDYSVTDDRMLDQEFVTRFLAFYMLDFEQDYTSNMDAYLNKVMFKLSTEYKYNDKQKDESLLSIKGDFDRGMHTAREIFGTDAFRKRYDRESKRSPINKALFDTWSVTLSKLSEDEQALLIERKEALIDKFIYLMNNNDEFENAISSSTGDKNRIKRRFSEVSGIVQSTFNQL